MKPLTEQELSTAEAEARRLAASGPALADLLGRTLPRVLEELRAARTEQESLRAALDKEKAAREKAPPSPRGPAGRRTEEQAEQAEAAGALLAAPFRVSAKAAAAARSDPLAALSVQVARALSPDAGPVDRARLIAMAFAASQADLEAFWTARRRRQTTAKRIGKSPLRRR